MINSVDPGQLASQKPAYQDLHYFQCRKYPAAVKHGIYCKDALFFFLEPLLWNLLDVTTYVCVGAQWLSGRVLDSRLKGRGFEPHWRH